MQTKTHATIDKRDGTYRSDVRAHLHLRTTSPLRKRFILMATNFRRKRFEFFKSLLRSLPRPLSILDVGGTQLFWETMEFLNEDATIVVLNIKHIEVTHPRLTSVVGDARDMKEFKDQEFDIVFSNSVLDHLETFEQQRQMAQEVQRVGKRYFVQAPNRFFPIEPHFIFPFFQFLPWRMRIFLATHYNGWGREFTFQNVDKQRVLDFVGGIRLVTEKELKVLFPGAKIYKEKFLGLTKSFIVYKW